MEEKAVLITGASSGIGKATAKYFQAKGWNVIATMRTPEKEDELTKLENMLVTRLDVTDLESISTAIEVGIERFGKIDVLVNNAGYGTFGALESFPRETMMRQLNTNLIGLLDVTRAVIPHFRKNKDGVIINISSVGGKITFPLNTLYNGTKFAVEGITESLVFEMQALGVKAKIVEPGSIATDFMGRSFDFYNDESLAEYQPMIGTLTKVMSEMQSNSKAAPPSVCAEVIYEAATDGKDTVRYLAGDDAEAFLAMRDGKTDEEYIASIKEMFGI